MPRKGKLTVEERYAAQLLALAHSLTETAEMAGLGLDELRRAMGHPLMEAEIAQARLRAYPVLEERLKAHLERVQEPALSRMEGLLGAESEPVQFQAARDLLNRGPLAPQPRWSRGQPEVQGATIHLDTQAILAILAGALNMGQHGLVAAFAAFAALPPQPALSPPAGRGGANPLPVSMTDGLPSPSATHPPMQEPTHASMLSEPDRPDHS